MENKFYQELARWKKPNVELEKVELKNAKILDSIIDKIPSRIQDLETSLKNKKQTAGVIKNDQKLFDKYDGQFDKQISTYQKVEDNFFKAKQKKEEAEKLLERYKRDKDEVRKRLDKIEKEADKYDKQIKKNRDTLNKFAEQLEKQLNEFISNAKKLGVDVKTSKYDKVLTQAKKALTKSKQ